MSAENIHVDDRLDDWLDGRLGESARREVEEHLAACAECRGLRDGLVAARAVLRSSVVDLESPAGLAARIGAALDREDEGRREGSPRPSPPGPEVPRPPRDRTVGRRGSRLARIVMPLAAGLALAVLGVWWLAGRPSRAGDPVAAAAEQYAALAESPALPAGLAVARAEELERRWSRAGLGFPVRVLDLSAMGIELAGGDATRLAGAPAARALYRGGGDLVACWMFQGDEAALPPPAEVRAHGGFEFRVYRRGETTLVVWREGEVLCALAGAGDPEQVIGLAFAKAMTPGAAGSGASSPGDDEDRRAA